MKLATADSRARDEAISWHLRLADASGAEWETFIDWLERDPSHQREFDQVEMAAGDLDGLLNAGAPIAENRFAASSVAANSNQLPPRSKGWALPLIGIVGSTAAALALVFSFTTGQRPAASVLAVETAAGQQRTLHLPDGSAIHLNGSSAILIDRNRYRSAQLERGEATFQIKHNASRPFTVLLDKDKLRDVGTIFNIRLLEGQTQIGVREGAVTFNPDRENMTLVAGKMLVLNSGDGHALVRAVDPGAVGAWQDDRLVYQQETLAKIAVDLERLLGTRIVVSGAISDQQFTGIIKVDRKEGTFVPRLGGLLGVSVRRSHGQWILGPGAGENRTVAMRADPRGE